MADNDDNDQTPGETAEPDDTTPDTAATDAAALAEGYAARVAELEAALAASEAASAATIADLKARNYDLMMGAASAPAPVEDTGDDLNPDDDTLDDYL